MNRELIIKGIHNPETARRIFGAVEDDPGELREVLTKCDVPWPQDFDFAVYEDAHRDLHTLAWFPSPSPTQCLIVTQAAACEYMRRKYNDWPQWLRASIVAITEDALYDEPITRAQWYCDSTNTTLDTGDEAVIQAGMAIKIIKGEV